MNLIYKMILQMYCAFKAVQKFVVEDMKLWMLGSITNYYFIAFGSMFNCMLLTGM